MLSQRISRFSVFLANHRNQKGYFLSLRCSAEEALELLITVTGVNVRLERRDAAS